MNVNELEKIKNLINKAKIESAKSEGEREAIKKEWKKQFGTDDVDEIKKKLAELQSEREKTEKRKQVVFEKIMNSYDWEALEEELC